ncbi:MAG: DNA topoisomerase IV subunit A [Planctomycetota bacterium]|nr:MAG: DNA topoisomerase IV subunit A [Planctomycetota bacterium]
MAARPPLNTDSNAPHDKIQFVSISDETRRRYLNYAMSVIMSRALPDVRDGLKPVQRRILYAMYHDLGLTSDAKYTKCAKITGQTTGNYHPHGNVAVYEALVRMSQDFTLRVPLIDGQGNFGSIIGLPPAAERYTEAKLTKIADQLMYELRYETVEMRANYDATRQEPVVLPARFPNLLVNGASGIAVGMATNMPPHNLGEVIKAAVLLIDEPEASVAQVMAKLRGPDFPLGGRIVTDRKQLKEIYEEGRGSIKVRAEWATDKEKGREIPTRLVIQTIPYGVETGPLMASLGEIRDSRKLPQLVDIADESNDEHGLRIIIEIKSSDDADAVMAYLFKHTRLEDNFAYNATCLVPDEHGNLFPKRCGITEILQQFLKFRFVSVRKRFEYLLAQLERRIHILRGFAIVFDGLDKALKIIRGSDGKPDAAEKLMKAFPLDKEQTEAILELALYRISGLEIGRIRQELHEKETEAERIRKILASDKRLWGEVRKELEQLGDEMGNKRRTALGSSEEITEFDPQAYIVRENTHIVLSTEGWVRRVGKISTLDKLRMREGDQLLTVLPGSTLDNAIFFSSDGTAYTLPAEQIPASTGYGEPLSKHIRLSDGACLITALSTDSRFTPVDTEVDDQPGPAPYLLIVTASGQVMRLSLAAFRLPSTKAGRRYCRLIDKDKVVHVELVEDTDTVFLISRDARLIHFSINEVPILSGAGKGVRGIKLDEGDVLLGAQKMSRPSDTLKVLNENDKPLSFGQMKYTVTSRGGKGVKVAHRSTIQMIVKPDLVLPDWSQVEG